MAKKSIPECKSNYPQRRTNETISKFQGSVPNNVNTPPPPKKK